MTQKSFDEWAKFYQAASAKGLEYLWPSETLVRALKGNYIPGLDKNYAGKKVLDVGFGDGSNLIFLASLGLALHGIEVDESICRAGMEKLSKLGIDADLRVGTNQHIPYPTDHFDLLVSWNVLHYENTEEAMRAAILEHARVLKPGGRFVLMTTGPEHKILKNGITRGGHRYEIGRDDDFRKGEVYFYFDAPNYIRYYFSTCFDDVLVGRTQDFMFTEMLDWFIVTGVKR